MNNMNAEEIMKTVERMRKQSICQFDGMIVDMDYQLCIPSIHATYQREEIVIDFGGKIRQQTDGFPRNKADALIQWVLLHQQEIAENHHRIGYHIEPLIMIQP